MRRKHFPVFLFLILLLMFSACDSASAASRRENFTRAFPVRYQKAIKTGG